MGESADAKRPYQAIIPMVGTVYPISDFKFQLALVNKFKSNQISFCRYISLHSFTHLTRSLTNQKSKSSSFLTKMASSSSSSDQTLFNNCLVALYLIAPPTYISLRFLQAPYGKHHRPGWGPTMSPPLAWFLMESPTLWLTLLLFPFGRHLTNPKSLLLISPFLLHYFNRTCLYPLRLRRGTAQLSGFPVAVALLAFGFNLLNAYLQARWVSHYKNDYGDGLVFWWRFLIGLLVFVGGMYVNVWSDKVLVGLKRQGGGYKVPRGGWFQLVSCPNYFGEIMEWFGWAIMTWSWVGFGFFLYTCANLVPRARANHRWYLDKFGEDYPRNRKAVIPFVY